MKSPVLDGGPERGLHEPTLAEQRAALSVQIEQKRAQVLAARSSEELDQMIQEKKALIAQLHVLDPGSGARVASESADQWHLDLRKRIEEIRMSMMTAHDPVEFELLKGQKKLLMEQLFSPPKQPEETPATAPQPERKKLMGAPDVLKKIPGVKFLFSRRYRQLLQIKKAHQQRLASRQAKMA